MDCVLFGNYFGGGYMNSDEKICHNCKYWQDYKKEINARISDQCCTAWHRNIIKMRPCTWHAHPSVDVCWGSIYTDEHFSCPEFVDKTSK